MHSALLPVTGMATFSDPPADLQRHGAAHLGESFGSGCRVIGWGQGVCHRAERVSDTEIKGIRKSKGGTGDRSGSWSLWAGARPGTRL